MVIDSKIMKKISTLTRLQASQMSANICQFSSESFVKRLKKNMNISMDEKVSAKKMIKLGKNIKPLVHRSPIATYMFSALISAEAPTVKEVKQKRQRAPTDGLLKETVTENVDNKNKTVTNDELVVNMFGKLVKKFRDNDREPSSTSSGSS